MASNTLQDPLVSPQSAKVSSSEELVFSHMAYRKLERQLRGTYKNDKPWTILWTFLTLLLLFGLVAPNFVKDDSELPDSKRSFDIRVNIRDLGFLSLMAVVITIVLVYTLTRVVVVVRWSLYWLLATLSILYLWKGQMNLFSTDTPVVILVGFGVAEFCTFSLFIVLNYLYPRFVRTNFFRRNVGVTWWFGLRPVFRQRFTLTYDSEFFNYFEGRRSCTYRGEVDADGLPHGFGNWLDDSFHGELLSGLWERGVPVGPFRSREFGSGFAFESLRVGFCHCSDDTMQSRNWFPSQEKLPTIGVASVECSVAGGFFSHLPRATMMEGPFCLASVFYSSTNQEENPFNDHMDNQKDNPFLHTRPDLPFRRVKDILPVIKVLYTEHPSSSLIITATRDRGVLVSGHSFSNSNDPPHQLIIDVMHSNNNNSSHYHHFQSGQQHSFHLEEDENTDSDDVFHTPKSQQEDTSYYFDLSHIHSASLQNQLLQQQDHLQHPPYNFLFQGRRGLSRLPSTIASAANSSSPTHTNFDFGQPHLKVLNWRSTVEGHVEALVFFPGFNASLEHSLQRLGQFMAMGRFPPHIKPFVFAWPCARELTYLNACKMARSRKTQYALEAFLRGLRSAGVEDVHFLAHSAGAQVVTTFFSDPDSGVARLFDRPFPTTATQSSQLLRLRTITLLNPDTKLSDFVVSDFKSMRRFCDHITVVGDRKDVALKWSERANGLLFSFKFIQTWFRLGCIPRSRSSLQRCCAEGCCQRNRHGQDRAFSHMPAVGRSIFSLYVFEEVDDDYDEEEGDHPPHAHSRHHRKWLDVDAIDTSSMETNVHQMRHAYFDLNKILVEDLHELIVTGKRASERSLLLHREGNIFSFCQAPACVVNQ